MIIKYVLASRPHNPHYLTKYINFITACQTKNEGYEGHTERHHICPKAEDMFPEFASFSANPWNCANLTTRQHYIAHLMLYKIYNNYTMQVAYQMLNTPEYKTRAKGYIPVRDVLGNRYNVNKDDPRYLSGELVPFSKGRVTVRDSEGFTFQVDNTDDRFLSGELVHVLKDRPNIRDRKLMVEQVIEVKIAAQNPTSIIKDDYIATVVKKSDIHKVGKVSIEELKYVNGRRLSYKRLLAKYYANKFNCNLQSILDILDNKTYKEIIV